MTANEMLRTLDTIEQLHTMSMELDDQGKEEESDAAYAEMWELVDEVADELSAITDGQISGMIARRMIVHHKEKLRSIIAKAAQTT